MGPVFGRCGHDGSTPAYGFPAPCHQYQLPYFPPARPHGYFLPYGMPLANPPYSGSSVEQVNHVTTHDQLSAEEANPGLQHQQSFEMLSQSSDAFPEVSKLCASKDSESKACTRSNSSESGTGNAMEGRNMFQHFPTSPSLDIPDCSP
ncbi:Hypothetical predicted protein [Olea europaea subsp. europaea]|uniref:Uncharacterized protein n=1 Tax=Olea europaea subsp. europaea TaxID=158383 RepID=A0A8S0PX73_OLEEU|nr:Hypothetical predicted protein [Olea europaea subsp. europaea]